ncbi:metallophosphoesterase family protein [Solimonas marina]|uniref:Metallophosphoesterase family protein n=1 Tax=Solimonas marina TaxID=2714601 RepID=A0A969WDP7_9GAMM|nr:metallophosphoesterase family protein [Solimonas marina]NKF24659.1 metallophosphoesterase family protein [Solimonas marina]
MRLALLSDIHGNLPALEAVLDDLHPRAVDAVVNLGDSLSGPLLPRETAALLMAQDWVQLAGNHERQLLQDPPHARLASDAYAHAQLGPEVFDWMRGLTHCRAYGDDVLLCHGSPRRDVEALLETVTPQGRRLAHADEIDTRLAGSDAALIACGHTHLPRIARSTRGQLIVNPGSVGLPAYADDQPYPYTIETGSPDARYAIVEHRNGRWQATLIAVPYAHEAMARLADANGRPDWAIALRTGRVA